MAVSLGFNRRRRSLVVVSQVKELRGGRGTLQSTIEGVGRHFGGEGCGLEMKVLKLWRGFAVRGRVWVGYSAYRLLVRGLLGGVQA